jgi:5-(carboxyamino)imidazole ribonucleotide mutase
MISVVLGSDSDIEIYRDIASVLKDLGVHFEKRIISAHRCPDILREYVKDAEGRGVRIFIAVAGMAAALPGVIASHTLVPVIGVPAALKSPLGGIDSILSMLQMPPGIPVACVAANGGKNAALLASQIMALSDGTLKMKLESYRQDMKNRVTEKDKKFSQSTGDF